MIKKFSTFFGFMGVISLLVYMGLITYNIQLYEHFALFAVVFFCGGYLVLDIIVDHRKTTRENECLLVKKRAIDFCASQKTGTRDELIDAYGEEMYDYLLDKGVIHELYEKKENSLFWEFTKRGEFVLNDLKSLEK